MPQGTTPTGTGATAYNANASNDSWFYRVGNGSWVAMNNTNSLRSGFPRAQGTASGTLTRGVHTLRIRNRESGLSINKLPILRTTVVGPSGTHPGFTNHHGLNPTPTSGDYYPNRALPSHALNDAGCFALQRLNR